MKRRGGFLGLSALLSSPDLAALWKEKHFEHHFLNCLLKHYHFCFSTGLKDDKDLKFLLKGSQLLKVKSSSWRKERFYKLQEDCKTIWQESKKVLRSPESQICE